MPTDELEREALARNDRYLREFVEAFELCPFAKPCRESGRLERRVLPDAQVDAVRPILAELSSDACASVEVALLIFPSAQMTFAEFQRFSVAVREAHQGTPNGFFVVPFHPDAPEDAGSPHRLVSFLRRSPDPTLQLVRMSVLDRVRGVHSGETVWMDSARFRHGVMPPVPPLSVSERIAQQGFETVQRVGLERLRELLRDMRPGSQAESGLAPPSGGALR